MSTAALSRKIGAGVAILLAFLCAGPAWGQGKPPIQKDKGKPPVGTKPAAAAAETTEVRVFKLNHADPKELQQMVATHWAALGGTRDPKGGPAKVPTMVVNDRTRTLFARGSEKELALLDKILPELDEALGGKEGKDGRVIRLKNARVPEVIQVLTGLGLQHTVIGLPKANALFLTANDGQTKAVRVVVQTLDTPDTRKISKEPSGKDKPVKPIKTPGKDKPVTKLPK